MSTSFLGLDSGLLGDIMGTNQQDKAAGRAADAQIQAAQQANDLMKYMYETNRGDLAPYRQAGTDALGKITGMMNGSGFDYTAFQNSPQYKFGLDQGMQGIQRQMAAAGLTGSGAALKAANNYAQNYANNQFGDYYNRLAGLAGIGQQATNQTGAYGANYASQAGNNLVDMGDARAGQYIAQGNSRATQFNNLMQLGMGAMGMMGGMGGAGMGMMASRPRYGGPDGGGFGGYA